MDSRSDQGPNRREALKAARKGALKAALNLVNLSTPAGLLAGALGGARFSRGPRGLVFATGYRLPFPVAGAFTVGNVVLTRHDRGWLDARPRLVGHEERHSWQYVWLLGLPMVPAYATACGWSWLRTGCVASRNPFERRACLADGGYRERRPRPVRLAFRRASAPGD